MAQSFKETAHLKTDLNKYGENYDRIFGKKEVTCPSCGSSRQRLKENYYLCFGCDDNWQTPEQLATEDTHSK
jgi:hypothetical protein